MRRFFVPSTHITKTSATLDGPEFHHLCHVLRLPIGAQVTLRDDVGREHQGVITHLSSSAATISITATTQSQTLHCSLVLAQGLLKGPKMDMVIEKATELGVQRILPFVSTFTVATVPNERQSERMARWRRIAQSAIKQSGGALPNVEPPQSFPELLALLAATTTPILFYEGEKRFTLKRFAQQYPHLTSLAMIVGPEGGFSSEEIELARQRGVPVVSLGTSTLRAETASIVALALCQFLWNG